MEWLIFSTMAKIGIFDSGYGGLTVLKEIKKTLPQYSYIYLGDNARTPYGTRSFDTVYEYTLQAIKWLFSKQCELIIVACNTASAKALRSIQQNDLPHLYPTKRILGVIRPVTEQIDSITKNHKVGLFGTTGTVKSESYKIELNKLSPRTTLFQEPCPMWVPLVENNEWNSIGADYFIEKHCKQLFNQCKEIDTVILGCTHYPILAEKIRKFLPSGTTLVNQATIVANSLADYLKRHPEITTKLNTNSHSEYFTTDCDETFSATATLFLGNPISTTKISLS